MQAATGEQAAVVRALASHQCVPGSIPGTGVICGLSLLLVLHSALRYFSPGTPVFPCSEKPTFSNSNSILECKDISRERALVNSLALRGQTNYFTLLQFTLLLQQTFHRLALSSKIIEGENKRNKRWEKETILEGLP